MTGERPDGTQGRIAGRAGARWLKLALAALCTAAMTFAVIRVMSAIHGLEVAQHIPLRGDGWARWAAETLTGMTEVALMLVLFLAAAAGVLAVAARRLVGRWLGRLRRLSVRSDPLGALAREERGYWSRRHGTRWSS